MKTFREGRIIRRSVTIRSSDRAIADKEWVLTLSAKGIDIRLAGARREDSFYLSWRSVISHALVHQTRRK